MCLNMLEGVKLPKVPVKHSSVEKEHRKIVEKLQDRNKTKPGTKTKNKQNNWYMQICL